MSRASTIPPPSAPGVFQGGHRLDEIAREVPGATVVGDSATRVFGVHHDSRAVEPGDLFVARRGATSDGTRFVPDAVARGAFAVLALRGTIDPQAAGVPVIEVDDIAVGLAFASACVYGHPTFTLEVVGITGTNGKTTTAYLVRRMIDHVFGHAQCGVIGTVGHSFGDITINAEHTTPEADEVARVMARFRALGATHMAMEVSSIALSLGRVKAVRFRVAAFTNLTQDHLDFHGSMEAYGEAKASLFLSLGPGAAVLNIDDALGRQIAGSVRAPLLRVSAKSTTRADEADIAPIFASFSSRGIEAVLRTPAGTIELRTRLVGAHNLENIVVALGVMHALELDLRAAVRALDDATGAPGRLERCDDENDDVVVLVDYAHTPDALAKVMASVRASTSQPVVCVFGCGGDRDRAKRGPMGEAAGRGADAVIVTSDNPRREDPRAIAEAAVAGVVAAGKVLVDHAQSVTINGPALPAIVRARAPAESLGPLASGTCELELDRRLAIRRAVLGAAPGSTIVIAGKGHETYQIVGTESRPFDDRVEARAALAVRRQGSL